MNRYHVRRAYRESSRPSFALSPEPLMIGRLARGRQVCAGKFLFAGNVVDAPDRMIWDIEIPDAAFERELHRFVWLDDLASVGGNEAWSRARVWIREWIRRFGRGAGPGWPPELTGQRLIRWINHSTYLLDDGDERWSEAFRRSLGHQIEFLSNRWPKIPQGLSRLEALTALVQASLVMAGNRGDAEYAIAALEREIDREINPDGEIPTRNPEELLDVLLLLVWTRSIFTDAARSPPAPIVDAIERIAPALRTLRHSDGALARFHGGGRGIEGRLDYALANSGARRLDRPGSAMGFTRLSAGRTTLIMDAAPPPTASGAIGHASTLAFEMTLGRRPMVISCGSGVQFGAGWARAGRTAALHSALEVDAGPHSSFSAGRGGRAARKSPTGAPTDVRVRRFSDADGKGIRASHDGYMPTHGLIHVRAVGLASDGGSLTGDDTLTAASENEVRRFERIRDRTGRSGIPFSIRFHLHPDVAVQADHGEGNVTLRPGNGEVWIFRYEGEATMLLQPSVHLEQGRLVPRETSQIVLSAHAMAHMTHVRWKFERARESPVHIRDLARENAEIS